MWILGINVGHNGSVALYNDANLVFFVEEERLTKLKYDGHPIIGIETAYKYTDHIDMLLVCHTRNHFSLYGTYNDVYRKSIKKKQPYHDFKYIELGDDHHLMHAACAFYNSNFDSAAALIVDGSGSNAYSSVINTTFNQHLLTKMRTGGHTEEEKFMKFIDSDTWEVESIWSLDYPANVQRHYASYGTNKLKDSMHYAKDGAIIEISRAHGIVKSYEAITTFLGFHEIDAGKTMGLSSYGKVNPYIAICDGRLNNLDFIIPGFPAGNKVNVDANPQVRECFKNLSDWHTDPKLVGEYRKDLAYAVQKSSENRIIDLIEKTLELTKKNKIVM